MNQESWEYGCDTVILEPEINICALLLDVQGMLYSSPGGS